MKKVGYFIVLLFLMFSVVSAKKVIKNDFIADDGVVFAGLLKTDDGLISYGSYAYYHIENPEPDDLSFLGGLIAKYDNNGNFVWDYKVGNSFTMFNSVKEDSDGNYIGVGGYNDPSYAMIVKLDKNGNELWEKNYMNEDSSLSSSFYDVETVGNEYIAVGFREQRISDNISSYVYIVNFSKDGEILWEINSLETISGRGRLNKILSLSNGNFMAVGSYYDDSNNTCGVFVEFDENGEIVSENFVCESGKSTIISDIIESKGNYLTIVELNSDLYFYLFDKEFNVIKTISLGSDSDSAGGLMEYNDGYIVSVNSTYYKDDVSGQIAAITYLDSDFNLVISEKYEIDVVNVIGKFIMDGNSIYVPRFNAPNSLCMLLCVSEFDSEVIRYDILYEIVEKETTNGKYAVEQDGDIGEIVITPDDGYVLDAIKIVDADGREKDYYEKNDNYYFELEDGLVLSVTFKEAPKSIEDVKNPETLDMFRPMLVSLISAIVIYFVSFIGFRVKKIN